MEGVILFADDHIYSQDRPERLLYESFRRELPTLGVHNLELAIQSVKSIGSFKALILDWQYSNDDSFEEIEEELGNKFIIRTSQREDAAYKFLNDNYFYSLIYIFSEIDIEESHGTVLKEKFGNRIQFRKKENLTKDNIEVIRNSILEDIKNWEEQNVNLSIPILWTQSIIKSVQAIFYNLSSVDPFWISELFETASVEPVEPSVEIINLFQDLLAENLIQDEYLNTQIRNAAAYKGTINAENFAKVVKILYFGKVLETAPIMTGDIINFNNEMFGIIITPECDIRHVTSNPSSNLFELLCFSKGDFKKSDFNLQANIKAAPLIARAEEQQNITFNSNQRIELSQIINSQITQAEKKLQVNAFTQTKPRYHFLPCFEFDQGNFSGIIKIDFRNSLKMFLPSDITVDKRVGKLNSPYIQELRQRYFAYKGRIGVPGHSKSLREWLLDNN
jgi:hypothetical protein